ncbi:carbon-nitrogen hydrolase [Coraliomargarita sinensis]|uniref:Carbon-nitrogen hydrolase n=1 Tax=Coraliomargarita sinensis TaxID=2174842 RepID=A0A317ZJA7_9BACT|nr:nitrilase-related carbon-nitrogen hydrolase [Coraliomargarita sinensis]PXA03859.1 carbon-nitrogen hydrolase [Coraliomargarita sinensis]
MKLSIAQLDVRRGDPEYNLDSIRRAAEAASAEESDLLCLPEMATTGFDWDKNRAFLSDAEQHHDELSRIAQNHKVALCGSFLERSDSGMPRNTLFYFNKEGEVLAKYSKIHLFSLFNEDQHVEAGNKFVVADIEHGRAGFAVCYDLRFPELFRKNTDLGAQIQILPAAFPHPRLDHWRTLVRARAIENQCYFIAVNQSGVEGHGEGVGSTHYFGHSMVVDPWGEVLVEAGEESEFLTLNLDLDRVSETRSKMSVLKDRRLDLC